MSETRLNVTRDTFRGFFAEHRVCDEKIAEEKRERKLLRDRIKLAGVNLKAFDRALRAYELDDDTRNDEDIWYARLMDWLQKPIGYQSTLQLEAAPSDPDAASSDPDNWIDDEWPAPQPTTEPKRRGRPRGSKNKPKNGAAAESSP